MDIVESARLALQQNKIQEAIISLDAVLQQEAAYSEDVLFDARCIRGTIASLLGPKEDPYLVQLRPKTKSELHIKLYLEATAKIRAGQPFSATTNLQNILRDDPHFLAARMGLAAAFMAQKQWNEAFQQYSEVLARTGTNAPAIVRVGLAICSMRREEFEHAKRCLTRALQLEPNDDLACMAMIVVQLQQRDGRGAAETIKRLYGLAPENPIAVQKFADLVFFKGITSGRLRDVSGAIRDLIATAVKLDDGVATKDSRHRVGYSKFQLGRLAHYEDDLSEATRLYTEAVSVLGTSCKAAWLYLAKAFHQLGKTNDAVRCLQKLEVDGKADKDVFLMLAAHHQMAGHEVRGMHYSQKLSDEYGIGDPQSYWLRSFASRHSTHSALRNLAIAKAIPNQNLPEKALQSEEFLRAQQPSSQAAALGEMLCSLQKIRNESDEIKLLAPATVADALTGNPDQLPSYYNIACAMAKFGQQHADDPAASTRLTTAQKLFVQIIKLFPTFIDPYYRLAELYINQRQFESALKWLSLALHVRPNDGYCMTMIAKLYFDNRNSRLAVETLQRGLGDADSEENPAAHVPSLALGSLYLWAAQQPSDKAPRLLLGAKECFSKPLRADPNNALAAHGLACCVGFGGNAVSKGAKSELTENCLSTVQSAVLNDPSIQEYCSTNMTNCMSRSQSYKRVIDQLHPRIDNLNAAQLGTLGYCLAADGQLKQATDVIQQGLKRFPQNQPLRYNRILVLYARITKEVGTGSTIDENEGRQIRNLLVMASDLSHEFVNQKYEGSEMSLASFTEAQNNVRAMAKQLTKLEECLQATVRKAVIEEQIVARKIDEWKAQATQSAAEEEARRQAEQAAADEEARAKEEKSRRRYDAMLEMQNRGSGGASQDVLAMHRTGFEGEIIGGTDEQQPELNPEEQAEAIMGEALAV